jgi:GT2 family glycosyltransferase
MSPEDFEVIVVDDCSSQDTMDYIKSINWQFNLRYFKNKMNLGRSGARNVGIEQSKGDVLVFTDDDCLLSPDYLQNHLNFFKKGFVSHGAIWNIPYLKFFSDPACGKLYPEYKNRQVTNLLNMCISEGDVLNNFDRIIVLSKKTNFENAVEKFINGTDSSLNWISCTGGNIAVEAEIAKELGGFDEQLGKDWGMEDIEFGYRLYAKGHKFQYINNASVFHMAHYRFNTDELSQKAIKYFYQKHKEFDYHIDLFKSLVSGEIYYNV